MVTTAFPGKILVTTDFSEASTAAFPYAADYARSTGAPFELLSILASPVIPFVIGEHGPSPQDYSQLRADIRLAAEAKLSDLALKHFGGNVPPHSLLEGFGSPADTILDIASRGYGLLIMATHGRGFLARVALGSVAERVLQRAPCPMLLVPSRTEAHMNVRLPYRKILVSTDFSPASEAGLKIARQEATRTGAKLILTHVIEQPIPQELLEMHDMGIAQSALEVFEKARREFRNQLESAKQSMNAPDVQAVLLEKSYSVANSLAEHARTQEADLIIISATGAGKRMNFIGGVAERVVRQAPCPVLVAPAR